MSVVINNMYYDLQLLVALKKEINENANDYTNSELDLITASAASG